MSLLQQLQANVSHLKCAGQTWRSSLFPSLLSLQTSSLATDLQLVTVGQQGALQEPLQAHSLVLAAVSPRLASLLATSRDTEVCLLLPGLERQELEGVLEDIYLGRDKARLFLQQWGLLEQGEGQGVKEEESDFDGTDFGELSSKKYGLYSSNQNGNASRDNLGDPNPSIDSLVIQGEEQLKHTGMEVKISDQGGLVCPITKCGMEYNSHPSLRNHIRINHRNQSDSQHGQTILPLPDQSQGMISNEVNLSATEGLGCPVARCDLQFNSHPSLRIHIKTKHNHALGSRLEENSVSLTCQNTNVDESRPIHSNIVMRTKDSMVSLPSENQKVMKYEVEISGTGRLVCPVFGCIMQCNSHPSLRNHIKRGHTKQSNINPLKQSVSPQLDQISTIDNNEQGDYDKYYEGHSASVFIAGDQNSLHKIAELCTSTKYVEKIHGVSTNSDVNKKNVMTIKDSLLNKYDVQAFETKQTMCPKCEKVFSSWNTVRDHCEYVHDGITGTCEFCGYEASKRDVARHIKRKHSTDRNYCNQCDYSSSFKSDIKVHKDSRHSGVKHICEDCGLEYSSRYSLQMHKKAKHQGVYLQCDKCEYRIEGQVTTMIQHKRMMHESSKFLCIYCPYIADTKEQIEQHKDSLHAEEINYSQVEPKNNEQKRKEKEKDMDFLCNECGKTLFSRQLLRLHRDNDHRGIRFPCLEEGCNYKAKQKHGLVSHKNSRHYGIRHKCDICDLYLGTATSLRIHKISKHKITLPIFACDKCSMRSKNPEKTKKHMLNMHN